MDLVTSGLELAAVVLTVAAVAALIFWATQGVGVLPAAAFAALGAAVACGTFSWALRRSAAAPEGEL